VIDLGRTRMARQQLQDAVDSASLPAAAFLPVRDAPTAGEIKARFLRPEQPARHAGRSARSRHGHRRRLRAEDRPAWNGPTGWVVKNGTMSHACDPYNGDLCNAVKVQSSEDVNLQADRAADDQARSPHRRD